MAIRHMISEPVLLLTPVKNGRIWIRYQSGRIAEIDVTELHAEGNWQEINGVIDAIESVWKWHNWDTPEWHYQGTFAAVEFNEMKGIEHA
jgi:hypothetical protein